MEIINVVQGSSEWLALRAKYLTASEAPAMLGVSKYQTRDSLLKAKATGITEEVTASKQYVFDRGHQAEALARPIVEGILGEDLFPSTCIVTIEGLDLLASLDGMTMDEQITWENKLFNESLRTAVMTSNLEPHYYFQLEQQLLVTGAQRCYFTTSDGTDQGTYGCWYTSVPERRAQLIAGWKQFKEDLANYQHKEVVAAPVGQSVDHLPALVVSLSGEVKSSNLAVYKTTALAFIEKINTDLKTDQDFADAEKMVKFCDSAEKELEAVKTQALSQTATIDDLFRTIDSLKEAMRSKRLKLSDLVKTRKESIKLEIVREARSKLDDHIATLNKRLGQALMPGIVADFAGAVKNKRTVESLRSSVNEELARAQIEASMTADRIQINVTSLSSEPTDWKFLFPDLIHVCGKAADDFAALLKVRVSEYEAKKLAEEAVKTKAADEAKQANDRAFESAKATLASATTLVEGVVPTTSNLDTVTQGKGAVLIDCTVATVTSFTPSYAVVSTTSFSGQPTDRQIISALASAFNVSEATAVKFIKSMDLINQPELI
jgi:putative phage-type endonuclease